MGLISAGIGALNGVLADQWKEFFYCDAMSENVLMQRGFKKTGSRSTNTKGNDNIISNGSVIAVADGQCMLIVEQGEIVDFCAQPGEYTYDKSTEPSLFAGKFGQSLIETFKIIGRRFTFGGDTGKDQRVYYINTKEIVGNKFGTASPVPFRIVDKNIGLDIDATVRCSGIYSYEISDPLIFYKNVCGNVETQYLRASLDEQLKAEFVSALPPAFSELSKLQMRPNEMVGHNTELENALNEQLSKEWGELRGLRVKSVAVQNFNLPDEYQEMITIAQKNAMMRDPNMAAAQLAGAQAQAMMDAAKNPNGAASGFVGMGMAMGAGGNTASLFEVAARENAAKEAKNAAADSWTCPVCGQQAAGNFCSHCGAKKPEAAGEWFCSECGTKNNGNFCTNCGKKR